MKKNITNILIIVVFAGCFLKCSNDPAQPPAETECKYEQGRRDFTWRADTVAWWPSTVTGIWAFSDDDAYIFGQTLTKDHNLNPNLGLHWDGLNYQKVLPTPIFSDEQAWGLTKLITKSNTGKIWMLVALDSQVFAVIQGI